MLELSEWSREVLTRSIESARRLNPSATVRLSASSDGIEAQLVDVAEPDDTMIMLGELPLYAAHDLDGLVDVQQPHDRLVLRPLGSEPHQRPE